MRNSKILLFILLIIGNLNAQNTTNTDKLQIHSPNTYALARYGDIPVNPSTGIPQINLPLIELTDKDIHLDISLSYHASGVKVDEEATWVGLGWTLNAGGMITRVVRGNPDGFNSEGNFEKRTHVIDYKYLEDLNKYMNKTLYELEAASTNQIDNAPDMFFFNFCGKSGKFFFDNSGNPIFTEYEDYKLEFIHNPDNYERPYFIITDINGHKYEFRDMETTRYVATNKTIVTAWYLSKIISPSGGKLEFTYKEGGLISYRYQTRGYNSCYMSIDRDINTHKIPPEYREPRFDRVSYINGIIPVKISSSAGNIIEFELEKSTQRKDSENLGNNQLNCISLNDASGNQIKKYKFIYSYFESNSRDKLITTNSSDCLNYRLKLDEIQEISTSNSYISSYKFGYHGDEASSDSYYKLPYRLSPSQDHWGYYNYSFNNSIFPDNPKDKAFHIDPWFFEFTPNGSYGGVGTGGGNFEYITSYEVTGGGTREPHTEAAKAATLNKIIYPTGGYTLFDFEAINFYSSWGYPVVGGIRIKQIEDNDGKNTSKIRTYDYREYSNWTSDQCLCSANMYYTWYYQSNDTPGSDTPANPDALIAFGVPSSLAHRSKHIIRIDGTPQIILGAGLNAIYDMVTEYHKGNGYIRYEYSFAEDILESSVDHIDNIPTPGMFYSAYL